MDLIHAVVLGVVQGLGEFLPISSSGHLIMVPYVLGWSEHSLAFDLALHLGTAIALLWYFWSDWLGLAAGFFRGLVSADVRRSDPSWRMAWLVILGSVPAGIVGLVFERTIETHFRGSVVNAVLLIVFGLLLFAADRLGRRCRTLESVTWQDALAIGIAQSVALFPGVSRSGVTMTVGLVRGLDRAAAARFSFLLSGPIVVAASLYKLRDGFPQDELAAVALGMVVSAVTGWASIGLLLRYLQRNSLTWFVVYRVAFGLLVLGVAFWRLR
jgi:undecaprenyl-diphosphatase